MIVEQTGHRCAHAPCACTVHESERWCSDHCRQAQESGRQMEAPSVGKDCGCGHPACSEGQTRAAG